MTTCLSIVLSCSLVLIALSFSVDAISRKDKDTILRLHRELRAKAMRGRIVGYKGQRQPRAKAMKNLEWKYWSLARPAQAYANKCKFEHTGEDFWDEYYATTNARRPAKEMKKLVGENLGISVGSKDFVANIVNSWADEVKAKKIPRSTYKSFKLDSGTGHYTQMVWGNTSGIGCGLKKDCKRKIKGKWYKAQLLVCFYGKTRGNMRGEPIYET